MAEEIQEKEENLERQIQEWTDYPTKRVEELRKRAEEKGVDPHQVALGYLINTVVGDDTNSFLTVIFKGFEGKLSQEAYQRTDSRLQWELDLSETPEEVKKQLRLVKEGLSNFDWGSRDGFNQAYNYWKENAQDWVLKYRDTHPEALAAYKTFLKVSGLAVEEESPET